MNKAFIAAAGVLAIGLSACAGEIAEPDDQDVSQGPVTVTPEDPAAEATTTAEPTAEPTPELDYEPIDMGTAPADMTAPGTALALGGVAWVAFEYTPADVEETEATASPEAPVSPDASPEASPTAEPLTSVAGISVLDVVEGDETYWERFSNPEDFVGRVPYFVVYQQNLDPAAFPDNPARLDLWPQYGDGEDAEFVAVFGVTRSTDCGFELPDYDPATGVHVSCFIGIGEVERPIAQVAYNGLDQFALVYD